MFNSKKIAATAAAGIVGSLALIGFGATQALADDGADACVADGETISCVQSQTCSGGGEVSCNSIVVIRPDGSEA
ncbi:MULTISPECIES: hypothetical protein [unclassified Streptomyces]|jgi:hypothetical protein|uniref:hypothetical protein n=1 Tax=unclassified Streptomyces TaxID=2593676 RepID=UPI000A1FD0DF|nr:hypothetical protein [Streptomyces sp. 13-12-16]OSP41129.1 hypothetical protein B7767_22610 [Streptomyces sp. 13-12-16]